jgi:ABC-type polysaccharide/polyol phosphate export permease
MNLQVLNRVCLTICIACIAIGTPLAFSMIWVTYQNEFVGKFWLTIGVLFLASAMTLIVSKTFGRDQDGVPQRAAK